MTADERIMGATDFEIEELARMVRDEVIVEPRLFEGGGIAEFLSASPRS